MKNLDVDMIFSVIIRNLVKLFFLKLMFSICHEVVLDFEV